MRVDGFGAGSRHLGLAAVVIRFAEEDGTAEVGRLDLVEVHDEQMADPHQGEVLDDLVAQRAGADHHDLGILNLLLLPPGDELEGAQPVFVEVGDMDGLFMCDGDADGAGARLVDGLQPRGHRLGIASQFLGMGNVGFTDGAHKPAHTAARLNQLVLFKRLESLAQGGTADPELVHQFTLGGEL